MRKGACVPSASPLRAAGENSQNARPEPELSRKSRTRPACSAAVQSGFGTCIISHGKASSAALVSWCVPFLSKRRTSEERKGGESMYSKAPDPGYWPMVAIVLITAMRQGVQSLSRMVCATMLFCVVAGLFSK